MLVCIFDEERSGIMKISTNLSGHWRTPRLRTLVGNITSLMAESWNLGTAGCQRRVSKRWSSQALEVRIPRGLETSLEFWRLGRLGCQRPVCKSWSTYRKPGRLDSFSTGGQQPSSLGGLRVYGVMAAAQKLKPHGKHCSFAFRSP